MLVPFTAITAEPDRDKASASRSAVIGSSLRFSFIRLAPILSWDAERDLARGLAAAQVVGHLHLQAIGRAGPGAQREGVCLQRILLARNADRLAERRQRRLGVRHLLVDDEEAVLEVDIGP